MKRVSFSWLWVEDEGSWKGWGGGISFSPNHAEDGWEETGKSKSEHADCRESKSSGRRKRCSPQQQAATPCFSWQVRVTTRNLESCNEWLNEQKQKKMSFAPDGPPSSLRVRASFFFVSVIKWANLSFFISMNHIRAPNVRFCCSFILIKWFCCSLFHCFTNASCSIKNLDGNNGNYFSTTKYIMCNITLKFKLKKIRIVCFIITMMVAALDHFWWLSSEQLVCHSPITSRMQPI